MNCKTTHRVEEWKRRRHKALFSSLTSTCKDSTQTHKSNTSQRVLVVVVASVHLLHTKSGGGVIMHIMKGHAKLKLRFVLSITLDFCPLFACFDPSVHDNARQTLPRVCTQQTNRHKHNEPLNTHHAHHCFSDLPSPQMSNNILEN